MGSPPRLPQQASSIDIFQVCLAMPAAPSTAYIVLTSTPVLASALNAAKFMEGTWIQKRGQPATNLVRWRW